MSGICIPGVKMPKDGELLCINIYPDGKVCINLDLKCKRIATAIPVPDHGRLIDADALITTFCEWGTSLERGRKLVITMCEAKQAIVDIIEDAPTIIPAEEVER